VANRTLGSHFRLYSTEANVMGAGLIIYSHGYQVGLHDPKNKSTTNTPGDSEFWVMAAPGSSLLHVPWEQFMKDASQLVLRKPDNYPNAARYTKNTSTPNFVLTKFKEKADENEGAKIENALAKQKLLVWDVLTVRKATWLRSGEATLAEAFGTLQAYYQERQRSYTRIVAYFCNVTAEGHDNRETYEKGYVPM
jgi:hypothetical protein